MGGRRNLSCFQFLLKVTQFEMTTIYIKSTLIRIMAWRRTEGDKPLPGVGVTKAPFANFSVSKIFDLAKVPV